MNHPGHSTHHITVYPSTRFSPASSNRNYLTGACFIRYLHLVFRAKGNAKTNRLCVIPCWIPSLGASHALRGILPAAPAHNPIAAKLFNLRRNHLTAIGIWISPQVRSRPFSYVTGHVQDPIGADPKMRSGQTQKTPSQILSILVEVASGRQPVFSVTGTDWPTRDGTGIRDYVHVWDLASAHVAAVERLDDMLPDKGGYEVINLGTGAGVTVREFVKAFESAYGNAVPTIDAPPRPGDVAGAYTSVEKAHSLLGWCPTLSLEDGIRHALEWAERGDRV